MNRTLTKSLAAALLVAGLVGGTAAPVVGSITSASALNAPRDTAWD